MLIPTAKQYKDGTWQPMLKHGKEFYVAHATPKKSCKEAIKAAKLELDSRLNERLGG